MTGEEMKKSIPVIIEDIAEDGKFEHFLDSMNYHDIVMELPKRHTMVYSR